jgi:hypothetical protein
MSSSYLIPIIAWLPKGYDCSVVMPLEAIAERLPNGTGAIVRAWTAYRDGAAIADGEERIEFDDGRPLGDAANEVTWRGAALDDWPAEGGYLEYAVRSADDSALFTSNRPPAFYNVYAAPGRKSFFACHTWEFGSPQVIGQIAAFGRYADAYPVVHIDRARDLGDSLVLINPYRRPILAKILTHDGRRPRRQRIEPMSGRLIDLAALIAPNDDKWSGQIQLTANNRVITHIVKHSLADPTRIGSVEHLDPFRADPTHLPLFRWLRLTAGETIRSTLRACRPGAS